MKLISLLRSRPPKEQHSFLSDDSDVTVMSLCMPLKYDVNIVGISQNMSIHSRLLTGWVLQNWRHAERIRQEDLERQWPHFEFKRVHKVLAASDDEDAKLASICQVRSYQNGIHACPSTLGSCPAEVGCHAAIRAGACAARASSPSNGMLEIGCSSALL